MGPGGVEDPGRSPAQFDRAPAAPHPSEVTLQLTVKLFATFRQGRFEVAELDRPEGSTLGELLDAVGIPRAELGILLVRGRHAELDHQPAAGDTIAIFPKVGGG